jgi:hypothetical protein
LRALGVDERTVVIKYRLLKEIRCGGDDLIQVAQGRARRRVPVTTKINVQVPNKPRNVLTSSVTIRFSRRSILFGVRIVIGE